MIKNEAGLYQIEVDGHIYEFEKWGAEESLDILLEMVPLIGGSLGGALHALVQNKEEGQKLLDVDMGPQVIGLMVQALTTNFKKDTVKMVLKKLTGERVFCDGKKVSFNMHYQDSILLIFKVAKAALEVQYGNFLEELLGLFGPGLSKKAKGIINKLPQT